MTTRRIPLTAEHVKKAIRHTLAKRDPTRCCPVFQALRDAGLKPLNVGYYTWRHAGTLAWYDLRTRARNITNLPPAMWPTIQPCEIEVEVPA